MTDPQDSPAPPPPRLQEGDSVGFEAGTRVPIVWLKDSDPMAEDDEARIQKEALNKFLQWLADIGLTPENIGRLVYFLLYEDRANINTAPQSLQELADRMGVSKARAGQLVAEFRRLTTGR